MKTIKVYVWMLLCGLVCAFPSVAQEPAKEDDKKEEKSTRPDDVPVIGKAKSAEPVAKPDPPAKSEPKADEPVSGEHAILPINLVRNRVESLRVGGSSYVQNKAIKVDGKRKCWLNPNALTGVKSSDRPVQVRRDSNGYHVVLESTDHHWEAEDGDTTGGMIPVRTIAVK